MTSQPPIITCAIKLNGHIQAHLDNLSLFCLGIASPSCKFLICFGERFVKLVESKRITMNKELNDDTIKEPFHSAPLQEL